MIGTGSKSGSIHLEYLCPECYREGGTSLERLDSTLDNDNGQITIIAGFECMFCTEAWIQYITVEIGTVVSEYIQRL